MLQPSSATRSFLQALRLRSAMMFSESSTTSACSTQPRTKSSFESETCVSDSSMRVGRPAKLLSAGGESAAIRKLRASESKPCRFAVKITKPSGLPITMCDRGSPASAVTSSSATNCRSVSSSNFIAPFRPSCCRQLAGNALFSGRRDLDLHPCRCRHERGQSVFHLA